MQEIIVVIVVAAAVISLLRRYLPLAAWRAIASAAAGALRSAGLTKWAIRLEKDLAAASISGGCSGCSGCSVASSTSKSKPQP